MRIYDSCFGLFFHLCNFLAIFAQFWLMRIFFCLMIPYYKDFDSSDISFCAVKKAKPRNAEMVMAIPFSHFFVKKIFQIVALDSIDTSNFQTDQYKVPVQII